MSRRQRAPPSRTEPRWGRAEGAGSGQRRVLGPPRRLPLCGLGCGSKRKPRGPSPTGNANIPQTPLKSLGPEAGRGVSTDFGCFPGGQPALPSRRPCASQARTLPRLPDLDVRSYPSLNLEDQFPSKRVLSSLVLLVDPSSLSAPLLLASGLGMCLVILHGRVTKPGVCVTRRKC